MLSHLHFSPFIKSEGKGVWRDLGKKNISESLKVGKIPFKKYNEITNSTTPIVIEGGSNHDSPHEKNRKGGVKAS